MASMSSLPPEMLGEIAACFQNDTSIGENKDRIADQNTLAILSRVSKSFQSVAQPLLHRKIYLAVWDPVGVSILSLIKVLHHREDLRSRVGQVHIHFERAFSCRLKRTMDDIRNLGPFARTIGRPNLGTALEECKNSSRLYDTVLSSLLFHQLQGVSQVMITGLDGPDLKYGYEEFDQIDNAWSVLPALLISPSETPEALLQNLIFLRLGAHIGTTMDLSHFHLLACLALNLENFEGFRFESLPAEAFNAFKKLKHLTLWEAPLVDDVSSNQQGNFEIPPGLHSFDYCVRSSWFSDELNISPIKVRRALVRHSDTLIYIYVWFHLESGIEEDGWFDTFGMFKRLEYLSVGPADFARNDQNGSGPNAFIKTLPRSPRSLTFLDHHHSELQDIEWLAHSVQKGDSPHLESFTIYFTDEAKDFVYTTLEEIWNGIDKPEFEEDEASFCFKIVSSSDTRELWCYW